MSTVIVMGMPFPLPARVYAPGGRTSKSRNSKFLLRQMRLAPDRAHIGHFDHMNALLALPSACSHASPRLSTRSLLNLLICFSFLVAGQRRAVLAPLSGALEGVGGAQQ